MSKPIQRVLWLDSLRGAAIVLMIVFHFCFDLRYFSYVDWSVPNGAYWYWFRCGILFLFIFSAGCSVVLSCKNNFRLIAFCKRQAQLFFSALLVTIVSLFLFLDSWIYFGILHFMLLAIFVSVFLYVYMRLSASLFLVAGFFIVIISFFDALPYYWPFLYVDFFPKLTEDFVPFFPWLGIMFLGVAFADRFSLESSYYSVRMSRQCENIRLLSFFGFLGRHSLLIYLVHQPLLFSGFGLLMLV